MRDITHYAHILEQNPNASVGFTLAAAAVYAARFGVCEAEDHASEKWKSIARRLKSTYGETLTVDEVRNEMERAPLANAAAALGSIGGSANTALQNAARATNAKGGGRPKGSKNKPKTR